MKCSSLAVVLALCCLGWTSGAQAGEEDAKTFFAEGRRLRAAGQCEAALVQFRRALETYPEGLGSRRNIAECEEVLGRFASARRSFWDLRREVLKHPSSKYEGWAEHAEEAYRRLAPRVARLVVTVTGAGAAASQVLVDGQTLAPELVGVEIERDPGVHQVEATVDGGSVAAETVRIEEGRRKVVTLRVPAAGGRARPPQQRAAPSSTSATQVTGWVFVGGAGLALAGVGIAAAVRGSALADLEEVCPDYQHAACSEAAREPSDRGSTAAAMVNVLAVVSAASAAVGVTLLVIDLAQGEDAPAAEAALRVAPRGVELSLCF